MTSNVFERAPTLETERLRLRAHTRHDLDACFAIWGDPDVTRFIGGKPSTREESWARIVRCAGLWALMGYGFWAIEDKASGRVVGDIGIMESKRAIVPSFEGQPEVGWALAPSVHGMGYASEALSAVLGWADANLSAPSLVCIIAPGNAPSLKLAVKFGFCEKVRTTYHNEPIVQFERLKPI
jgi:RimJ/RimL family protein N-acetyltransferase